MCVILRRRNNGKTRIAVDAFLTIKNSILVVPNEEQKKYILQQYLVPRVRIDDIITPGKFHLLRGRGEKRFIFDNVDQLLSDLCHIHGEIIMMTMTDDTIPVVYER